MPIRVLIVDDSSFARDVLCEVFARHDDIEVIGQAGDGKRAEEMVIRLKPDVVTMDVIMPMVGGLDAIQAIMARCPTPIVVVSDMESDQVNMSIRALQAGAINTFAKPRGGFTAEAAEQLVTALREAAQVSFQGNRITNRPSPSAAVVRQRVREVKFIGIVSSTGGPQTLQYLLRDLKDVHFPPVAIVQHTTVGFTRAFTSWLAGVSGLEVVLAEEGRRITAGTIAVAPDECHLEIRPGGIANLHRGPKLKSHRPSGTLLLRSLARSFGASAAAVVLTGMGDDGADGAGEIEKNGGLVFVQQPGEAVLPGMPRAALDATVAPVVGSVLDIRSRLFGGEPRRRR